MAHTTSRNIIRMRFTQALILIIVIIAAVLFAQPAEAQRSPRKMKSKQTRQIASKSNSNKACYLLYKKRTAAAPTKRNTYASAPRRAKYKPMAETDAPVKVASLE